MSADLTSRKALINILEDVEQAGLLKVCQIIELLEDQPKAYEDTGWIPVEERLPEVGEYVLGTNQYDEVLVYHYGWNSPHTRKMFFHLCGAAADIIAWRPLPEPYRPEVTKP